MAIGSWSPEGENQASELSIEQKDLQLLASLADDSSLETLNEKLSGDEQQRLSALLSLSAQDWQTALQDTPTELFWPLIRFFTVAEMKLPGWQCGNDSPVIKINRFLKSTQQPLDKDQLQWIRSNTSNRYLPNGSVL